MVAPADTTGASDRFVQRSDIAALTAVSGLHVYVGRQHRDGRLVETDTLDGLLPLLGLSPGALAATAWIDLVHPDDRDRYQQEMGWDAVSAGPADCFYRLVGSHGREVDVLERVTPTATHPDGSIRVAGVITDVSNAHGLHRRARSLADQMGVLFWNVIIAPDGAFRTAPPDTPSDGLGGASDRLFTGGDPPPGVTASDAWRSRIHPDDVQTWEDAFLPGGLRDDQPIAVEYRMIGYDRVERVVSERALVRERYPDGSVRLEGAVRDITVERDTARAVAESRQRFTRLAASMHAHVYEGAVSVDGHFLNTAIDYDSLDRFLGGPVDRSQPVDEIWLSHIIADDRVMYGAWAADVFGTVPLLEYRIRRGDGTIRTVADWSFVTAAVDGSNHVDGIVVDVSDTVDARRRASELEQRLESILDSVDVVVATIAADTDGRRSERFRGPGADRLLGIDPDDQHDLVRSLSDRAHPADAPAIEAAFAAAVASVAPSEAQFRLLGCGTLRWIRIGFHPRSGDNADVLVDCVCVDATDEAQRQETLRAERRDALERLRTDDLTGVASRTSGVDRLRDALAAPGVGVAVALMDVDHFKRVNDTFRHQGGDTVLQAVAQRLRLASTDASVARFGGEEFLIVLPGVDQPTACRRFEQMRIAVSATPIRVDADELRITVSAGVAWVAPDDGVGVEALIDAADRALHAAKRRGRARLVSVDEVEAGELLADDPDTLRLAHAMSEAVAPMVGESEHHCEMVSRLAGEVAAELGLGAIVRLRCRIAGVLHDFGKIAVPPDVLGAARGLTARERQQMQRHAEIGARMVRGVGGLADAATAIHHHHERWDGTGYPTGLAGAQIPIEARIIAVVDTWSAMIEPRRYRLPASASDALAELERCAGTQFDPVVVAAFRRVLDRRDSTQRAA
jgi:diguanylate cyclase (GGDEF)-like protein/putative nucleotidyltransferase with HDIG domain